LSGRCSDSLSGSQNIRRTASLDTIYLKGQWPRDSHYIHTSLLVDKATQVGLVPLSHLLFVLVLCSDNLILFLQTEEWSSEPRKVHSRHPTEQTIPDEKLEKYFRHRYLPLYLCMFVTILQSYRHSHPNLSFFQFRLQRTNKEGTSSRERTAAFGLIMPGGPLPALPGDHSVLLPSIASQTSARKYPSQCYIIRF
jgi:hypothetical protein